MTEEAVDYKALFEKEKEKNKEIAQENERLRKGYEELEHFVPKQKLKPIYKSEKETNLAIIQRAIKRNQQTHLVIKTVNEFKNSPLSAKIGNRNKIIQEFLKTEKDFVSTLNSIMTFYFDPLKIQFLNKKKKPLVKEKDFKIIFSNIEQILLTHTFILLTLEIKVRNYPLASIGEGFLNQVSFLNVHISFCNKFDESNSKIKELTKFQPEFAKFLEEARKKTPGNFDLKSLFIQPIQRLPRYSLLLKELIKNTDEEHSDFENLTQAKQKVDELLTTINTNKKKYEIGNSMLRVTEFSSQLNLKPDMTKFLLEDIADVRIIKKKDTDQKRFLIFFFKNELIFFECVSKKVVDYVSDYTDPLLKTTSKVTDPLMKNKYTTSVLKTTSGVTNSIKKVTNPISDLASPLTDTMKKTIYDEKNCEHIIYSFTYETKNCKKLKWTL
eukprot:gene6452-10459_t